MIIEMISTHYKNESVGVTIKTKKKSQNVIVVKDSYFLSFFKILVPTTMKELHISQSTLVKNYNIVVLQGSNEHNSTVRDIKIQRYPFPEEYRNNYDINI